MQTIKSFTRLTSVGWCLLMIKGTIYRTAARITSRPPSGPSRDEARTCWSNVWPQISPEILKTPKGEKLINTRRQCFKTFYSRKCCVSSQARKFATAIHFHPSLMFAGKARSVTLERGHVTVPTLVGSQLDCKYLTRVEVIGCGKQKLNMKWQQIRP